MTTKADTVKEVSIAVVGATGAVGREFLKILEHSDFPPGEIKLLASSRSAGRRIPVRGRELVVEETTNDSFSGVDIAFISASTQLSGELAPVAVAAGALVIDDSSYFRMQPEVPLVVPEVNGQDVEWHGGIISIPNCSTTPLVMVAHPLHRINPIRRIVASTYQSVSGAGGAAMAELQEQTRAMLDGGGHESAALPHQIAFNVIPRIDSFLPDGYTREEQKMTQETQKIMHAPEILLSSTCVRVPVPVSHSAALHLEFERPISPEDAREILGNMPGVTVLDRPEESLYPMPYDVAGTDAVFVGRIRQDMSHPSGLVMWVVSDNLRKGAALNALQIAEEVLRRDCLAPAGGGKPPTHTSGTEERNRFEQDYAYYKSHLPELLKEYAGQYVAIIDKVVVDSDPAFSSLSKRVYEKHGVRDILMTLVEEEERVISIPSRPAIKAPGE